MESKNVKNVKNLSIGFGIGVALFILLIIYAYFFRIGSQGIDTSNIYQKNSKIQLFILLVVVIPFLEELLCRKLIFKLIGDKILDFYSRVLEKNILDVWIERNAYVITSMLSALAFITLHKVNLDTWLFYLLFTLSLCLGYSYTKSILTPIVAHATYNAIQILILFLYV